MHRLRIRRLATTVNGQLYPPIEPHDAGMLDVGDGHFLHWEVCGNPDGKPAVVLHGGPGWGCSPGMRRAFDPDRYRIVLFDQRNCGRSTPSATGPRVDLSTNTTAHLVADLERLRVLLGIERWLVQGGSWGVTLAFVYAEQHPERVSELVQAAVTSGTRREVEWITRDMGRVFPREWERFRDGVDWCAWEDVHVSLAPDAAPRLSVADPAFQLGFARLVTHYWANGCFLADGQVLGDAGRLAGIPGVMVHGRFDVSGPLDTAWHMHRAWPDSELVVVGDAGHGGGGMSAAVVAATDRFADRR